MEFFNVANHNAEAKTATVQIMEQIGYDWFTEEGTEATEFIAAIRALGDLDEVDLEISSPGGNVHQGVSIANFIDMHPAKWTAKVIGNAASIASVIACACDTVVMGVGTNFLVHKPSAFAMGFMNADQFREKAANLDVVETSIVEFYQSRVSKKNKTSEELADLMREDRLMSANEAIEWGFADSRTTDIQAVACANTHALAMQNFFAAQLSEQGATNSQLTAERDALKAKLNAFQNPALATNEDVIKAFKEAEMINLAGDYLDTKMSPEALKTLTTNLSELKSICDTRSVNFEDLGKLMSDPVQLVATAMQELEAALDKDIDGNHSGDDLQTKNDAEGEYDSKSYYEHRNRRKQ